MRDRIKTLASRNGRSMNSEIIFALRAHLAAAGVEFGDQAPAAEDHTALARGMKPTNG